jgi:hypothetical protein
VIYWRVAPDGSRLTIRWLQGYERWEVKRDRDADWFESRPLSLALAAATGDSLDATWIREVELEIGGGEAEPDLREARR